MIPDLFRLWYIRWGIALICISGTIAVTVAPTSPVAAGAAGPLLAANGAATSQQAVALHWVGRVNLRALAAADARHAGLRAAGARHVMPLRKLPSATGPTGGGPGVRASVPGALSHITGASVPGESGFTGITVLGGAKVNPAFGTVTPPDQGLAVGPSRSGTAIVEFVNIALHVYRPGGGLLLRTIPAYQIFHLSPDSFLSDPRAYWDAATGHWFYTMFTVGDGSPGSPLSRQYIAVSATRDPLGTFAVFSIDTSNLADIAGGCPCLGDFDQIGADANGIYIATVEFSVHGEKSHGTVIYAISKKRLIQAAQGQPVSLVGHGYRIGLGDPFGSYHLSPASVPPGAASPGTEYFVESNSNLPFDNKTFGSGLEVFALLHTAMLTSGLAPVLALTRVRTEAYSQPPNAIQKPGQLHVGSPEGRLQTDFNAVQEVTYAHGLLYAELSTGFDYRSRPHAAVAWFILRPHTAADSVTAGLVSQGYVKTTQSLLYPVIGVNGHGRGYLAFALSGAGYYPSAAYLEFLGRHGAAGDVHVAAGGSAPLDVFDCYPPHTHGQCRYGDYSAAQFYQGRIYLATEYVAPVPRTRLGNWATRIWSAPVPAPAR
jgi:hypothetical protein